MWSGVGGSADRCWRVCRCSWGMRAYFPTAFILSAKSEAKPSSRLEDRRKDCQSSERKRQKVGNS